MRNKFSIKANDEGRGGWENTPGLLEHAASPDQLSIVWGNKKEAVGALPVPGMSAGTFDVDVVRLPADFNLVAALKMRRESHPNLPAFSGRTNFLTVTSAFNERTRILALDGEILSLNDAELVQWLVNAESQMLSGVDNYPLFETSLEETACSISRLPNGQVAMTEVPRNHIEDIREKIGSLFASESVDPANLVVETPLRAMIRYFLTALPEGTDVQTSNKRSEVTAFLLITRAGFSYGLWSAATGLFSEYGFLAPREISRQSSWNDGSSDQAIFDKWDANKVKTSVDQPDSADEAEQKDLELYIRKAFDQLFFQLSPEKLEQLQLSGYGQMIWVCEAGMDETISQIATDYSDRNGLDIFKLEIPPDEAAAGGLLFGSFTFGDETITGAEILPPVNLARDLLIQADKEEFEQQLIAEASITKQQNRSLFMFWAAPVLVLAAVLGIFTGVLFEQIMLGIRNARADSETQRLKPALERRRAYENTLTWYQEFITQVSALRRQQPIGIGMLYEINQNIPVTIDPSFYISELKLKPDGEMEIKGLARNKDAVTSFLRSLEFSGGTQSGTTLFNNLTYEVQEGVAVAIGQNAPNLPGDSDLAKNNLAPGIIAWSIRGSYSPVVATLPPDPTKNPPGANPPGAAVPPPANPNNGQATTPPPPPPPNTAGQN
jgi:Tfp pilus assembly protein PilN